MTHAIFSMVNKLLPFIVGNLSSLSLLCFFRKIAIPSPIFEAESCPETPNGLLITPSPLHYLTIVPGCLLGYFLNPRHTLPPSTQSCHVKLLLLPMAKFRPGITPGRPVCFA